MKGIERLEEIIVNGTKLQRSAAAYQLYWNIRDGKGASADKRRSMKYLRVAAENGSVDAMYQMGWHYGTGTFVGKNIVKVLLALSVHSKQGNSKISVRISWFCVFFYLKICSHNWFDTGTVTSIIESNKACHIVKVCYGYCWNS